MEGEHGFFVPDREYLVDLPGLLSYLGEKVGVGNICLFCNGRPYSSLWAVRNHMLSKSHCKLLYEPDKDEEEYEDFYDFTSSYGTEGHAEAKGDDADKLVERCVTLRCESLAPHLHPQDAGS
jgi:pre-60S factor REI1